MPNWSSNALVVKSDESAESESELTDFLARIHAVEGKDRNSNGIFNIFIPIDPALLDGDTGTSTPDWYTWRCDNWGTKWDVGYNNVEFVSRSHLTFETAWAPPTNFVLTVSKEYPHLLFTLAYSEQGMAFAGTVEIQNGQCMQETKIAVGYSPTEDEWAAANPDCDVDEYWDSELMEPNDQWQFHMDHYHIGRGG